VCSTQTLGASVAASKRGYIMRREGKAAKKDLGGKLRAAARKGLKKTIKNLLSGPEPPPIDARDPATQRTPLMEAAQHGQLKAVDMLGSRGADVNARDSEGCTPLMLAARSSPVVPPDKALRTVTAFFLQRHKSALPTLDAQDAEGFTALMHAASKNHKCLVEFLLSKHAERHTRNWKGKTAWHLTTCRETKALLEVGQDRRRSVMSIPTTLYTSRMCAKEWLRGVAPQAPEPAPSTGGATPSDPAPAPPPSITVRGPDPSRLWPLQRKRIMLMLRMLMPV
jgi:ankyrin repeat protein